MIKVVRQGHNPAWSVTDNLADSASAKWRDGAFAVLLDRPVPQLRQSPCIAINIE